MAVVFTILVYPVNGCMFSSIDYTLRPIVDCGKLLNLLCTARTSVNIAHFKHH